MRVLVKYGAVGTDVAGSVAFLFANGCYATRTLGNEKIKSVTAEA